MMYSMMVLNWSNPRHPFFQIEAMNFYMGEWYVDSSLFYVMMNAINTNYLSMSWSWITIA